MIDNNSCPLFERNLPEPYRQVNSESGRGMKKSLPDFKATPVTRHEAHHSARMTPLHKSIEDLRIEDEALAQKQKNKSNTLKDAIALSAYITEKGNPTDYQQKRVASLDKIEHARAQIAARIKIMKWALASPAASPAALSETGLLADIEAKAMLSDDVYKDSGSPEGSGWTRLSDSPQKLQELGLMDLKPEQFFNNESGFHAALYEKDGKYVLAFRGSEQQLQDWINNGQQGIGLLSAQYEQAISLAKSVKAAVGEKLEITGHSLGGGLASAAVAVTDTRAVVFNPSGLHPNTLEREGIDIHRDDQKDRILALQVEGEVLTAAQENPFLDAIGLVLTPGKYISESGKAIKDKMAGKTPDPDYDPILVYEAIGTKVKIPGSLDGKEPDFSKWNLKHNILTSKELHLMDAMLPSIRQIRKQ